MPIEKSAGAIIFRRESRSRTQKESKLPTGQAGSLRGKNNEIYYLLLHYPSSVKAATPHSRVNSLRGKDYWDFPKGHIEKGEKEAETIKREIEEETGLKDIKFIEGFKEWIKYFFRFEGKTILKFVTFFLVETQTKEVKVSSEHLGYIWLPYEGALRKLTFGNARGILKKANTFITTM